VTRYVARRVGHALVTMAVAAVLVFVSVRVLPGNPLLTQFGQHTDPVQMERIRKELGWDQPIWRQFIDYVGRVLTRGDLGESIARPNESVARELARRVPATIELALAAMLIALPLGIVSGVAAAVWHNRWPDYVAMIGALVGVSVPVFFLGICLKAIFTDLPSGYRFPIGFVYQPTTGFLLIDALLQGRGDLFFAGLRHLFLPALALSSIPTATIARITRSAMLDALTSDYVRTAKAKGSAIARIVWRHALPNAAVPVASIAGFQVGMLLSGAVLTETVFDWPGIGEWLVAAVKDHDYAIVQAGSLLIAAMFVLTNLFLDLLYAWLDPRIRLT
jgi:ABC-type dipeptide/oligopeptide/nickel transport system permease component